MKDSSTGARVYVAVSTSTSFIAASVPPITKTFTNPGTLTNGLLVAVLIGFGVMLLQAPFDWLERWLKALYLRIVAYIEPKDRGSRLPKVFGIRIDVIPFLFVGQLIAAFNAPTDAIPPLTQLLIGCGYGVIAALIVHVVTKWPEIRLHRRLFGDGGEMRAQWFSIALAVIAVAIAQYFGFAPGLLVGIFSARHFRNELDEASRGRSAWHLCLLLIAAATTSWVLLDWVRSVVVDPESPIRSVSDGVLSSLVVAGSQGLVWVLINPAEDASKALRRTSFIRWFVALFGGVTMTVAIIAAGAQDQGILASGVQADRLRNLAITGAVLAVLLMATQRFLALRANRAQRSVWTSDSSYRI